MTPAVNRNSMVLIWTLVLIGVGGLALLGESSKDEHTQFSRDEAKELAYRWRQTFVNEWNSWQSEGLLPTYIMGDALLEQMAKESLLADRPKILAQALHHGIEFYAEDAPVLSVGVLQWPIMVLNGSEFEYVPSKSVELCFSKLIDFPHFANLQTPLDRSRFALTALSFMKAFAAAPETVRHLSFDP